MQNNEQDQFDDFDDLTGANGDEVVSDDDMTMAPDVDDSKARRKRQAIFYAGIFGVLCVGAVGAWLVFFSDSPSDVIPTPAPVPQAAIKTAPELAPIATTPSLPDGVTTENNTPVPSVSATTAVMPMPSEAPTSDVPPSNVVPTLSEPPTETTAAALPEPNQSPSSAQETTSDTAVLAEDAPIADSDAAERLSAMESQLQTLAAELTAAKAVAPTASNPDPALSGKLQQLTSQLEQMTSQLDALDQRTATLATEVQNSGSNVSETTPSPEKIAAKDKVIAVQEEETVETSLSDEMPKPADPVKKIAKAPVKKAPVKKAAAPAVVRSWELRSAQPGIAWLGRPGSGEMARYAVGENVPGLGSVRSVTQDANGNWVVNTSGGTVKQ